MDLKISTIPGIDFDMTFEPGSLAIIPFLAHLGLGGLRFSIPLNKHYLLTNKPTNTPKEVTNRIIMTYLVALVVALALNCCCLNLVHAIDLADSELASDKLFDSELKDTLSLDEIKQIIDNINQEHSNKTLVNLKQYTDLRLANCKEEFFRGLVSYRKQYSNTPLIKYFSDIIRQQRKWCEDYLNHETTKMIGQFSESTRDYLEFLMSHDKIGTDFYIVPDNSITKLRQIVQSEDIKNRERFEEKFGNRFFEACREITNNLNKLLPIHRDHEIFARLPLSCDRYMRINTFCDNLINFDYLEVIDQILIYDVKLRSDLIKFGRYLSDDSTTQQLVDGAALAYAVDYEFLTRKNQISDSKKQTLTKRQLEKISHVMRDLKLTCLNSIDQLDNLIWLRDFAGYDVSSLMVKFSETRQTRLQKYLKTINACQQMPELDINDLVQKYRQQLIQARQQGKFYDKFLSKAGKKIIQMVSRH